MLAAAGAVLVAVIVVALGRGGELTYFQADYSPLKLDQVTATDVALFRPPVALWGYNAQATDEALNRIATALTERDIEISALQQQVADLEASAGRRGYATSEAARGRGARRTADPAGPLAEPETLAASGEPPPGRPSIFGDDIPPSPRSFEPHPPPDTRLARRPDPPFTRSARPDARSRFGLPGSEDEDE